MKVTFKRKKYTFDLYELEKLMRFHKLPRPKEEKQKKVEYHLYENGTRCYTGVESLGSILKQIKLGKIYKKIEICPYKLSLNLPMVYALQDFLDKPWSARDLERSIKIENSERLKGVSTLREFLNEMQKIITDLSNSDKSIKKEKPRVVSGHITLAVDDPDALEILNTEYHTVWITGLYPDRDYGLGSQPMASPHGHEEALKVFQER